MDHLLPERSFGRCGSARGRHRSPSDLRVSSLTRLPADAHGAGGRCRGPLPRSVSRPVERVKVGEGKQKGKFLSKSLQKIFFHIMSLPVKFYKSIYRYFIHKGGVRFNNNGKTWTFTGLLCYIFLIKNKVIIKTISFQGQRSLYWLVILYWPRLSRYIKCIINIIWKNSVKEESCVRCLTADFSKVLLTCVLYLVVVLFEFPSLYPCPSVLH